MAKEKILTKTQIKALNEKKDVGCEDTVFKILDLLNGETFNDCEKILKLVTYFLREYSFADSEMAKSLIQDAMSHLEDEDDD